MSNRDGVFGWLRDNAGDFLFVQDRPVSALRVSLDRIGEGYTFMPDEPAYNEMKEGFKALLLNATNIQLALGAMPRGGIIERSTIDSIISNFDAERDYQDTKIREQYGTTKEFTLSQEYIMCDTYLKKFVENNAECTRIEIVDNSRKIGAMAVRVLENNWNRAYTSGITL